MHRNWDDLRFALALARAGSFSAAGRLLGVNHTTVMRRVEALEDELGTTLFDKTTEGYVPTPAGEALIRATSRIEEEVQGLDRTLLGTDEHLTGTLRLRTVDLFALDLAPLLTDFGARYPRVSLEVSVDNDRRPFTRHDGEVALVATDHPAASLVGVRLLRLRYAIYGTPSWVARAHERGLGAVPWLVWDEPLRPQATEAWMRQFVPRAHRTLTLDSPALLAEAVAAGAGLALLPVQFAERRGGLEAFSDPLPDLARDLWLLTHPELRRVARVRALMEHLAEGVRRWSRPIEAVT